MAVFPCAASEYLAHCLIGTTLLPTVTGGIPEAAQRIAERAASTDSDSETCLSERTLSTLVAADSDDVDAAAATEEDDFEDALEFDSWRFIKQLPPLSAVRIGAQLPNSNGINDANSAAALILERHLAVCGRWPWPGKSNGNVLQQE